jgi:hypothetical protein
MRKRYWRLAPSGLCLALLSALACSTPNTTTRAVSQAELAVDEAAASEAETLAPADLQLARSKLAQAEQAARSGHHDRARRLAEQAMVDAQLAEAKAESEAAGVTAREVETRIEYLQRSLPPAR